MTTWDSRPPGSLRFLAPIIAVSIVVAASPTVATPQGTAGLADLRQRVEAYQSAWNTHDATAVAAFFSEDADLVLGNLPAIQGREAIKAWWRTYFEKQETERRTTFDVTSARLLTPTGAVVNVSTTTTGRASGGEPSIVEKARATWLLHRDDGDWFIGAMRGLPTEEDRVELTPTLETAKSLRPDIRAFVRAYEDAFDRHDPDALSAFYRDDADIIIRNSPVVHGTQAIQQWWENYFGQPRPYRVQLVLEEIRIVGDDVALLNLVATGAAVETTAEVVPVRSARATWVVVREDGQWLIAALRVLPSKVDRIIRAPGH